MKEKKTDDAGTRQWIKGEESSFLLSNIVGVRVRSTWKYDRNNKQVETCPYFLTVYERPTHESSAAHDVNSFKDKCEAVKAHNWFHRLLIGNITIEEWRTGWVD